MTTARRPHFCHEDNHDKQCPNVQAVLIVSHPRPQVTAFAVTAGGGWEPREFRSGPHVRLEAPEAILNVDDKHAGIGRCAVSA